MEQSAESVFPEKYRVLSGSALKMIALITMIIDHIGAVLLSQQGSALLPLFDGAPESLTLYQIFRTIGRIAFPLYCFLITEGCVHTHDRKKYGANLLIFALLSELPWNLEHSGTWRYSGQNVFFTLFLGFCCICIYDRFRDDTKKQIIGLLCMILISLVIRADYGTVGMGFILMLYVLREKKVAQAILGCCLLNTAWKILPAFALINLYNGKRGFIRGKVLKYLFYAAYPVHMLILYLIRVRSFGGY
ncbi:MAG: TraX protein [Oscillospiraceae bacterium]|nr:TraX protein [Oscillospiraceae bacterium]